jgi:hypothetical protein
VVDIHTSRKGFMVEGGLSGLKEVLAKKRKKDGMCPILISKQYT